jgi:hypothetical protein
MTAQLPEPLLPSDGIVIQYEVQFSQGHTCGGAYLKLLSQTAEEFKPKKLRPKTPFSIMFGPDRCGPEARVRQQLAGRGALFRVSSNRRIGMHITVHLHAACKQ